MEFEIFPKIPRFRREITISEKIDGTNAQIMIDPEDGSVKAGSRTREITPEQDNYGFAKWVYSNKDALVELLGPGRHFGEWWGQGIQRNYGLKEKRFSLFNTKRWDDTTRSNPDFHKLGIYSVPIIAVGEMNDWYINRALDYLNNYGSLAAPGFMNPEGIIIYHSQSNSNYKILLENDEIPKSKL